MHVLNLNMLGSEQKAEITKYSPGAPNLASAVYTDFPGDREP